MQLVHFIDLNKFGITKSNNENSSIKSSSFFRNGSSNILELFIERILKFLNP